MNKPITFSREVRLGDLLTIAAALLAVGGFMRATDVRLEYVERETAASSTAQVAATERLRAEIRESIVPIAAEQRVQGDTIHRIEEKINRARL